MFKKKNELTLSYLGKNIFIAIGLVLVWRGIWYVLDGVDKILFGGSHNWSAILGIIIGIIILYIPDKNLKKLENL